MIIYIFKGDYKNIKEKLLREAAAEYSGVDYKSAELLRETGGKPYFKDAPFSFSISHTAGIWACLFSSARVGFDIQVKRGADFGKIAGRFYTPEEAVYTEQKGAEGFYDVWVRKEAIVKYIGEGLLGNIGKFSVLKEETVFRGGTCYIKSFDLNDEVKYACCSGEKFGDVRISEIWAR